MVLAGGAGSPAARAEVAGRIKREATDAALGIDIDEAVHADTRLPDRPTSPATMDDADPVLRYHL